MAKHVARPGVREGYDRWSSTYDATTNALVGEHLENLPLLVPTATKYLDRPLLLVATARRAA